MSDYGYGPKYEWARLEIKARLLMDARLILSGDSATVIIALAHAMEDAADEVKTVYYRKVRAAEEAQFHRENAL